MPGLSRKFSATRVVQIVRSKEARVGWEQNRSRKTLLPVAGRAKGTLMAQTLGMRCRSFLVGGRNLKIAWMLTAGIVAFYVGAIRPHEIAYGINNSKASGLAAVDQIEPLASYVRPMLQSGVVGGVPGGVAPHAHAIVSASLIGQTPADNDKGGSDRKMVRTSTLEMIVQKPSEVAEKIRALAEQSGGFLVSSEVRGYQSATIANLS